MARYWGGRNSTSTNEASCPIFIAPPRSVPNTSTACSATSACRASSISCARSGERARLAISEPASLALLGPRAAVVLVARRTFEVGMSPRGLALLDELRLGRSGVTVGVLQYPICPVCPPVQMPDGDPVGGVHVGGSEDGAIRSGRSDRKGNGRSGGKCRSVRSRQAAARQRNE